MGIARFPFIKSITILSPRLKKGWDGDDIRLPLIYLVLPEPNRSIFQLTQVKFGRWVDRFLGLSPDISPLLRSNILFYYLDISSWGFYAGATAAFLTIYAVRVGATPSQIGLLTALPAAISLLLSLPFAGLVRRMGAHRATWIGALFSRLPFLLYALLPFLPDGSSQVIAILVIAAFLTIPNTLIGIGFSQLMMEAIPPEWRGTVVGVRNALFSIITFVVTMATGQILTRVAFPVGYQIVFIIGFLGAIGTAFSLNHVHPLPSPAIQPASEETKLSLKFPAYLPPVDGQGRRYLKILGILFLFNSINNMVSPLTPGILVNTLQLSDAWISFGTAANSMIVFLISMIIFRLVRRTGNRGGTALGTIFIAIQAAALGMARDPSGYVLSVIAGGLGSGILSTAQFNYHLENVPEKNRSAWLSWNFMLGNAALLAGSLLGPLLARETNTGDALLLISGLRIAIGLVIFKWG
jgi:MFS family permease